MIPRSVSVGGHKLTIKIVPDMEDWGQYEHDNGVILLSSKTTADPKLLVETLRHEMLHAALSISGVAFAKTMDEESVVRALESIFFPAYERLLQRMNHPQNTP